MNAVVLVDGWREGGPEGAREQLRKFWKRVSLDGVLSPVQRSLFDQFIGFWSAEGTPAQVWLNAWQQAATPLRIQSARHQPAARRARTSSSTSPACAPAPRRSCSSPRPTSGPARSHVFDGPSLTVDHILASACLPNDLQGGRDRRRALLGRRLHRQPAAVPAVLRGPRRRHRAGPDQPGRAAGDAAHRARDREPPHRDQLQRHAPARAARHRFRQPAHRRGQAFEGRVQARQHAPHPRRPEARRAHRGLAPQRRVGLLQGAEGSRPRDGAPMAQRRPTTPSASAARSTSGTPTAEIVRRRPGWCSTARRHPAPRNRPCAWP